ncbi:hypothetical protein GGR51DRAFT_389452 [Nemania sp. FL0031]|nr:hypothetical protein GGR51DRAFT_389452 [Nemania sp. FL0031]
MGSPCITLSMTEFPLSMKQRNPLAMRAPYCSADNCYRALFPCPSPWIVTEAVGYCATVSDASATNYPTQAVAACGTGKERYVSACSCPATNCPVKTTTQVAAPPPSTVSSAAPTTAAAKDPAEDVAAPIPTSKQTTAAATQGDVSPTQAVGDTDDGLYQNPSGESVNDPVPTGPAATAPPGTEDTPLDQVSSTHDKAPNRVESITESHSLSISGSASHQLSTPQGQLSTSPSLGLVAFPPGMTSHAGSTVSSETAPLSTPSQAESTDPSRSQNGSDGTKVGLVAAVAVVATLAALLLCGALAYCCLKRRAARRRARALTVSRPSGGFDAVSEWKPPIELPHQNTVTSPSQAELEDSLIFPSRTAGGDDASSSSPPFPVSPSALSTFSSVAELHTPPPPPPPPPAELFVLPAELSGVHKNRD